MGGECGIEIGIRSRSGNMTKSRSGSGSRSRSGSASNFVPCNISSKKILERESLERESLHLFLSNVSRVNYDWFLV